MRIYCYVVLTSRFTQYGCCWLSNAVIYQQIIMMYGVHVYLGTAKFTSTVVYEYSQYSYSTDCTYVSYRTTRGVHI